MGVVPQVTLLHTNYGIQLISKIWGGEKREGKGRKRGEEERAEERKEIEEFKQQEAALTEKVQA